MARRALTWVAIGIVGTFFAGSLFAQVPIVGSAKVDSHGSEQSLPMGSDGNPSIGNQSDTACASVVSSCTVIALLKGLLNGGTPTNPATVVMGAASLPLPVAPPAFSVPYNGSVTSAATVISFQPTGYASVMYQWTSEGTGNTTTIEQSLDGTNWAPLSGCIRTDTSPVAPASSYSPTTNITVICPSSPYQRARVSTYGSGTVTINAIATMLQVPTSVGFGVSVTPTATGGITTQRVVAVASNNAQNIVSGQHAVFWVSLQNLMTTSPVALFVGLYNTSGTPTCTNAPVIGISVPATTGETVHIDLGPFGKNFSNGVGICITTDPGGTTGTAAGAAAVQIGYQ